MTNNDHNLTGPAPRLDAWKVIGPGGGGTMIGPTISPHDPNLVLEHCDMTGAYITTDGARSWRMFNLGMVAETFAFDPKNPDVIYAGSHALWRSDDRGKTWRMLVPDPARNTVAHMQDDHADTFFTSDDEAFPGPGINVSLIAVDPRDPARLYVVWGSRGLEVRVSDDRGKTWRAAGRLEGVHAHAAGVGPDGAFYLVASDGVHALRGDEWEHRAAPGPGEIQYAALAWGSGEEPTVYALTSEQGGIDPYCERVMVSRDGGGSWEEATEGLLGALPEEKDSAGYRFRALACQEQGPDTAYVGFVCFGKEGRFRTSAAGVFATGIVHSGIAKTTDGGRSWEVVFSERNRPAENLKPSWIEGRKPDNSIWLDAPVSLGVAPTDPDVCYATDLFRTYRTLDGGQTWETVNSVDKGDGRWTTRGLDVTTTYGVHFDPHDVKHVFISYTDIGLFRSEDGGETWMGATEGIPNHWRNTTYWVEFDPETPGLMWGVFSGVHDIPRPKMWRGRPVESFTGGVAVSTDGGRSWTVSNEGMPETAATHILLDPTSPKGRRTLYVCGFGRGVYKSTDNGKTWQLKNHGLEGKEPFAWRIIRADDGALYLIAARRSDQGEIGDENDGALYKSTDGAETWTKLPLPEGCNGPNGLALDPRDNRRMYLAAWGRQGELDDVGGGLFLSEDGGETWRPIFTGSQHLYDVTIDPNDADTLYVCGFDQAAFRSTDGGKTWARIKGYNFKWGHRVVPDPVRPDMIYITTFGGSVWHGPAAGDPNAKEDVVTPVPSVDML